MSSEKVLEQLNSKAVYSTGTASRILGINPKTLINYENHKLIKTQRSDSGRRLFSQVDLFKILLIRYLLHDKGMTFKGVKLLLSLLPEATKHDYDIVNSVLPDSKTEDFINRISG